MMNTFEQYLTEPYILDFNQMQMLHAELLSELGDDTDAVELYEELVDAATKYAAIRAKWGQMPREDGYRFSSDIIS